MHPKSQGFLTNRLTYYKFRFVKISNKLEAAIEKPKNRNKKIEVASMEEIS